MKLVNNAEVLQWPMLIFATFNNPGINELLENEIFNAHKFWSLVSTFDNDSTKKLSVTLECVQERYRKDVSENRVAYSSASGVCG